MKPRVAPRVGKLSNRARCLGSLGQRSLPALPYLGHAKPQRDDGMYSRIKYKPPFRPYTTFRSALIEFHCQLRNWALVDDGVIKAF